MLRRSWLLALVIATAAHAEPDKRTRALHLFDDSDTAYKAGEFERAAELLRQAYDLYPEPILLYNLGRALEGLGDAKGAIEQYQRYLAVAKHVDDRGAIERRIDTLKAQLAPPPPQPPPAQPPPPAAALEAEDELDVGETAGWVAVGTGGAMIVTGALFGWRANVNHDDAVAEPVQARASDLADAAHRDATIANVMFGVGGALVIGGAVYEYLHAQHRAEAQVAITPRGIAVGWAW